MEEVAYADQMSGLTQQDATLLSSQQIESKTTTIHEDLIILVIKRLRHNYKL